MTSVYRALIATSLAVTLSAPGAGARILPVAPVTPPAPAAAATTATAATADSVALQTELEHTEQELLRLQQALLQLAPQGARRMRIVPPAALESLIRSGQSRAARFFAEGGDSLDVSDLPDEPLPPDAFGFLPHGRRLLANEDRGSGGRRPAPAERLERARRSQTFALREGEAISLTHEYGDVVVEPAEGNRVEVVQEATLVPRGAEPRALERYLAGVALTAEHRGDSLVVEIRRPPRPLRGGRVALDLTLRVPPGHPVSVRSTYGDVLVRDLTARVRTAVNFGDVDILRTSGPLVVRARQGDVVVRRHDGPLQIDHAVGTVGVQEVTGPVDLLTLFGEASLTDLLGPCTVRVRGARLTVADLSGALTVVGSRSRLAVRNVDGPVAVSSDVGDVRLEGIRQGGSVDARHGRLEIAGARGDLRVRGRRLAVKVEDLAGSLDIENREGDVVIDTRQNEALLRNVLARTWGGAVVVYMPDDPSVDVDASARHGDVRSDLPLNLTRARNLVRAAGRLGAGAAKMTVSSDSGGVLLCTSGGLERVRTPRPPRPPRPPR